MTIPILSHVAAIERWVSAEVSQDVFDQYHLWYYGTEVFVKTKFLGVPCIKCVTDAWNYQEILFDLKPSLIIETGTANGGSALFFSCILKSIVPNSKVISIDIDGSGIVDSVRKNPHIELIKGILESDTTLNHISELKVEYPGHIFAILDSDHTKKNVLLEMESLRDILSEGDYLVVEDGNINGHPVYPLFGEGPFEALEEYMKKYPDDYTHDKERENKFGFTFSPKGYLIRQKTKGGDD
jgi:cephalosporin hydroxylase